MLRLHPGTIDYIIIAIYFVVVLGIGFIARLSIKWAPACWRPSWPAWPRT